MGYDGSWFYFVHVIEQFSSSIYFKRGDVMEKKKHNIAVIEEFNNTKQMKDSLQQLFIEMILISEK